jgi:phosphoglycerol transferase MdoB-like AlkP superfamily enzyme
MGLHTRFAALWLVVAMFIVVSTLARLALIIVNFGQIADSFWSLFPAMAVGFLFDLLMGLALAIPFGLYLLIVSGKWLRSTVGRWFHLWWLLIYLFGIVYLAVVELFFFGEFSARFNFVAVDYLIFPHEVFVNLWDTYPVLQVMIGALLVSGVSAWFIRRTYWRVLAIETRRTARIAPVVLLVGLVIAGVYGLSANTMKVSANRIVNEIAGNGFYTFCWAAYTSEIDYDLYYASSGPASAISRLRSEISLPGETWLDGSDSMSITRALSATGPTHPFNIVLVLEESFGSQFVGSLHPDGPRCTPRFDSLAANGLFFRGIYATGNRTVRGIEASLCSFPPLPGNSIVRRPGGENVFSLPALLKGKGYQTEFLYGGLSYFDNLGRFASTNGFDRVIDQTDFDSVSFKTIWGVCDEDLFTGALLRMDTLHAAARPFFATVLTVSNHSPYTYPAGRIAADPKEQRRENAVKYADYCIGKFIRDARSHRWFDSTLFVFLGDHGARVYGSQAIPLDSYEIPILFYCPALIPEGRTVDIVGSQLDLPPTILGLLNMEYNSAFFGRNLLAVPAERTWALMSHNRDISLFRDDTLAVLGMGKTIELWRRNDEPGSMTRINPITDSGIVLDAIAYYQTAFELYKERKLHPLPQTPLGDGPSHAILTK